MAAKKKTAAPAKKKTTPAKKAAAPAKRKAAPAKKAAAPAKKAAAPAASTAPSSMPVAGQPAPNFSLPGDDGKTWSLAELKGRHVVVYFYPRDNTPGCTTEACDFRDNMNRLTAAGAVVLGISTDGVKSHQKFREKHGLNFPLLADEQKVAHGLYGAWGTKNMYGRQVEGTIRSTFLVGPDGKILRAWPKVKVEGHVDQVLAAIG